MSFQEVAITVRAINEATATFETVSVDAAKMGADVAGATREVVSGFEMAGEKAEEMAANVEISGAAIREATRDLTTLGTGVSAIARLSEQFGILDESQASCIRTMGTVITAFSAVVRAIDILRSSEIVATVVTWAYNASLAAKITLLTFGAGAIIVAAAAMAALAMQTRAAASAVRDYNVAAAETPTYTRSIRRAGEEDLRRRGIE